MHRIELQFRQLLEKLPAAAYTCDPTGLITYFNQNAVQLWGRTPKLNDPEERFCGSFRLYSIEETPIAHDQCWMALALQTDSEFNGREIVIGRPNGTRLTALAHANPIHDHSGKLLGAVNVLVDISERKRAEEELRQAAAPSLAYVFPPGKPRTTKVKPTKNFFASRYPTRDLPLVNKARTNNSGWTRAVPGAALTLRDAHAHHRKTAGAHLRQRHLSRNHPAD